MSLIVGITGKKRHGKDTIGAHLVTHFGFRHLAFADEVKAIVMEVFNLSREQCYGAIELKEAVDPRWGVTPRYLMQQVGTEVGRNNDFTALSELAPKEILRQAFRQRGLVPGNAMMWINHTLDNVKSWDRALVTDCRYLNEAKAIQDRGGVIVRVVRPDYPDNEFSTHDSETKLAEIKENHRIVNYGTLDDLYAEVDHLGTAILGLARVPPASH